MEPLRQPSVHATDDPAPEDRALRPQRMDEMVGQRAVAERLEIAIDAARKRGEPPRQCAARLERGRGRRAAEALELRQPVERRDGGRVRTRTAPLRQLGAQQTA